MPYWCAAFGPNSSFFFNSLRQWSMYGLPDRINALFAAEPKAQQVHDIALGPNGSYAIVYTDATGIKVRHSGLPQAVEQWLLNYSGRSINSARDLHSVQIALGPNGSYFAFDKNGCIWGGLPPALDAAVNERRDDNGCFKPGEYPYLVSLGAAGTYAMFTVGGGGTWYFGGQKPQLEQYLYRLGNLMHAGVILSPFDVSHYLLVTGQGVTIGVCPDTATSAYLTFAEDWRSSIEAEVTPPPPSGAPRQQQPPQLPPRRPSSVAADAQTRHSYIAYSPPSEHRPSLPPRPFSDTMPAYTAYAPFHAQMSSQMPPPPAPNLTSAGPPGQNAPSFSPPQIKRRPVKGSENPHVLSPERAVAEQAPYFPPPPPYAPNPTVTPAVDIKSIPTFQPPPTASSVPPQAAPNHQLRTTAPPQNYQQDKAAAKAKRDQRIKAGLKMGKMAMQGLAIGAALVNIASGNGGDIPSFDFGSSDDVPMTDMAVPVPVPDTSAYWQPLQDCASMPIE